MKKKRQSYAIASEILYTALSGVHKTRMMYSCNLSNEGCTKYINSLLRKRLLEKKEDRFHTTKRGIQFIETYQKLERLWEDNIIPKSIQRSRIHKKRQLGLALSLAVGIG
jgi:predicted transcriptional regulator